MSWRRILLWSLVLVAVLGGITWAMLDRSALATELVRSELDKLLRPAVHVGRTQLELGDGRLRLLDLRVASPNGGADLLRIDDAAIDVGATFGGPWVAVHGVAIDGFAVELGPELPTAAQLLAAPNGGSSGSAPISLPAIALRRGKVTLHLRAGAQPLVLRDVEVLVQPEADGRARLTGQVTWPELDARLALGGTFDFATGRGQLGLELTATTAGAGIALTRERAARFCALAGAELPDLQFGGAMQRLSLVATLPGDGAEPQLLAEIELTGAHLRGGEIPALVRDAAITLQVGNHDGGSARVRLTQKTPAGQIEVAAKASALLREKPQLDVRLHATDVVIDEPVLQALGLFPVGVEIRRALQPTTGRADLVLYLQNPQARGGITELDLSLRDVAMRYHGFGPEGSRAAFPLPMKGASGRVRMRDDVLLIDDVHATIDASGDATAPGTVTLQGVVDTNKPGGEDTNLDIRARGVGFGPELRQALAALLHDDGALYDKFAPRGTADVDVAVRPRSILPGVWSVTVRPQAASMQWAGFPFRLDGLSGEVTADEDDVRFDLRGKHGSGTLAMQGLLPIATGAADGPGFAAHITLTDVAVDDELRTAVAVLAPDLDAPWQQAAPRGTFSGEVRVGRARPESPLSHDAVLDLRGVDLMLPVAPWQALGLEGQVLVQGAGSATRVDFDALRGRVQHDAAQQAQLAMLGHLVFGPERQTDLAFVVRDLQLDDQLGRTLDQLDALSLATWQTLAPSGRVDLVCRYEDTQAVPDRLRLAVHLVDVRSDATLLPRPAEHMTGELAVADGELTFTDVRAELGGAPFHCTQGRVRTLPAPDHRAEITFTVDANDVLIDDGFANLFADPLHTAILNRHPHGRADITGLRLGFLQPTKNSEQPFETSIAGELRLRGLDLQLGDGPDGIVVEDIHGQVMLAPSRVSSAGGALRGVLRNTNLRLFGHPFERVEAEFAADAERLVMPVLSARWHHGTLDTASPEQAALQYLLPTTALPQGRLSADLRYAGIDVYSFLDTCGWNNPPYSGRASGVVQLAALDGYDIVDARGRGSMRIVDADLGVVPLFTAIYAQLPAADRPRFHGLDVTFALADRSVAIEQLEVRSDVITAKGKGSLGLDGYLAIEMALDNLLGSSADPLFMPLVDYLAKNLVTFYLHGYLRDLQAEKRWLTESPPARRRIVPMPPATERAAPPPF
ncbi:MAG: hypothetical protein ACK501_18815 [Planctomycetota bacterium]